MTYAEITVVRAARNLPEADRHALRFIDIEFVIAGLENGGIRLGDVASHLSRLARERRES